MFFVEMETAVVAYKTKVNLLLEKLLEGKCESQIDEYLPKLLIHLWWEERTDVKSTLPIFTDWIVRATTAWNITGVKPPTGVISFTLNLAGLLLENEQRFNELNCSNFFTRLINITRARQSETAPSVKLAYIKLLSSFLEHKSGVEWMIACNYWEDILNLSLSNHNNDLTREGTQFMGKILEKTIDFDENFNSNVVKKIMLSMSENIYRCIKALEGVTDDVIVESIQPSLKLIGNVLENFLKGICFEGKDFGVPLIFLKNFHLEDRICDFMIIGQKQSLVFDVSRITFIMQFLELYGNIITQRTTSTEVNASVVRITDSFTLSLFKEDFQKQIDFCKFGLLYWKLMDLKIPSFQTNGTDKKTIFFSDQLVLLLILPNHCFLMKYCIKESDLEEDCVRDHVRNNYFNKMLGMVSCEFIRVVYFWRSRLIDCDHCSEICMRSLSVLKESRSYFTRDQAVLCFQVFVYFVKDVICIIEGLPEKLDVFINEPSYVSRVLELIAILIEDFQLGIKDTIETTYVMALCLDFVALAEWSPEVVIQVLKLISIAIAHYMAPEMALLVDSTKDSPVTKLGPLLHVMLLNTKPGVQKAALEVVYTVARMSHDKFPSLQKVLMDSELPTLVVKMSACDGESFVRATAIKCLQEMIQVEEIWNNALKTEDLSQKMRDVLLNESEGIVRVEAATFMCVAYEHQQLPKDTLDRVYETMIYSSTTDLHWEVKVRALGFWDKVIKNHLQNQGMIDGSFPNVTFSKEHRKIVTLTDSEIRKRLLKVLSQLSSIGCLGVLMSAIKDDCDMEVSKTAVQITQRLVDLFKKYNVRNDCSAPTSPLPTENGMSATVSMSSGISVDESMDSPTSSHPDLNEEIIEQIVNSKDVSLLKNVYAPSDYGSVSNYDIQVRKIVTPNEFLQFTQQDLNGIITEKKKWLNGIEDLGSLLDDMLKTYDNDVNNMDCY